jgi:putative flippase GtrA
MLVCLIAAAANVVGVLALVAYFALDYLVARILVAIVVALAINYPLHRRVVFVTSGRFVSDE